MAVLQVWMNGEWVGTWQVRRGTHSFEYAPSWVTSQRARPVSLSLPLTPNRQVRGEVVAHFFDNLLPDNDRIRERIATRFKTRARDAFSLLEAIGRDCVGAVQLLPDGVAPEDWSRVSCEALSEREIAGILRGVPQSGPARDGSGTVDTAFRISLAGAQEKTAFTRFKGRWCRPLGSTPSTHIFKLPLGTIANTQRIDLFDSVENEWVCSQILAALGLPIAPTEMARFDGQQALVVERFDRAWMDGGRWVARLPQEDFCQALGLPSRLKYEADGGPSVARCLQLLSRSSDAPADMQTFQLAQLAFWLMAAPDGHAKNFSIFLRPGQAFDMTPLYDVLSIWPYVGKARGQLHLREVRLAMAQRGKSAHYALQGIQARHWHTLAMKNGGPAVWEAMMALAGRVDAALDAVEAGLPRGFPARIWESIAAGMRSQAGKLLAGASSLR